LSPVKNAVGTFDSVY